MATISLVIGRDTVVRVVGEVEGGVDTDLDPSEKTVLQVLAQVSELWEGVVSAVGLQHAPHVFRIAGHGLGVGGVGVGVLNDGTENLIPEELADVSNRACEHELVSRWFLQFQGGFIWEVDIPVPISRVLLGRSVEFKWVRR